MSAEELVTALNTYFNVMVSIIIEHKGIIDKFIGDAIMALFGAPVQYADDPQQAILTGLSMIEALKSFNKNQVKVGNFNKNQVKVGKPIFKIGVGLNTGQVVVGNIGSTQKLEYTCIGDTVNLASRLEGLTKVYGVPIIISEYTLSESKNNIKTRELDAVRVKGKVQPAEFTLYRPLQGTHSASTFRGLGWRIHRKDKIN
jgi:adenylate cyclase